MSSDLSPHTKQNQIWTRLSTKALQERSQMLFSNYELTNAKMLEKKRLDLLRKKKRIREFNLSKQLTKTYGIKKP